MRSDLDYDRTKRMTSVLSDTPTVNTGYKTGVNKRLADHIRRTHKRHIHWMECQFHINEIFLKHVILDTDGPSVNGTRFVAGAAYNLIPSIKKPADLTSMTGKREIEAMNLNINVMAKAYVESCTLLFSEAKADRSHPGN